MATLVVPRDAEREAVTGAPQALQIPSLDGLRAVSFFIVFAAHAGFELIPGGLGVMIFFFLSGYLITTLMGVEVAKTGGVSLKNFYLRRALRILPPFYLVLFGATALRLCGFPREAPPLALMPVASQILHFSNYWIAWHGWSGVAPGTGVYWSLAVEEHFYLLFPFVFLALVARGLSGREKAYVLWGGCAVILAWRCVLVMLLGAGGDRTYLCSDTRIDSIAFGCALALWNNPLLGAGSSVRGSVVEAPAAQRPLSLVALVAGVGLLVVTLILRNPAFRETFRYSLQGVALTPIFAAAVRWPRWFVFRALNWRPVRFIGTLSYVLYLSHQAAIFAVHQNTSLRGLPAALTSFAIAFAIAWATHHFVERPCAKMRKNLSVV